MGILWETKKPRSFGAAITKRAGSQNFELAIMELKDGVHTFYAKSQEESRKWLKENHQSEKSVWLIIYKKESGKPSVNYTNAVDEASC
ncbi:hypothetical protein FHS68_003817 [Dyadobacter arcticus]|uniref:Uncharacterized protein n=1 Tax=Dyadobacter arcticus TaxID=1078754 RepID=A0ABX0USK5_9BACT|nr:hypothetical protein [Dyadobacter arcticus]